MRTVRIEKLTCEGFAPFGTYYDFDSPDGLSLSGELHKFYPDRLTETYPERLGFSQITVRKPEKMIISAVEFHTSTPEIILPLNDDMILHVAPASAGKPAVEHTKAFLVPVHTLVKIDTAIWHLAPLPAGKAELRALIILPACTYMNDIKVVELAPGEQFCIEQ